MNKHLKGRLILKERILLGSYTRNTGTGIYQTTLDTITGALTPVQPYITTGNPTYLATSLAHRLYSVLTTADSEGGLAAFNIQNFEQPQVINQSVQPGSSPAYVAIDEKRQLVYSANYHKGQILVHHILPDGSLKLAETVTRTGKGPKPEQEAAHIHFTDLTPDGRLIVCDLGSDEVLTYHVTSTGKLTLDATFKTTPGFGPRHLVFHPQKPIVYLIGELGSVIMVLNYDPKNGQLEEISTIATLPENYTGHNGGAAIRISGDGRFLYASNRGANTIATFAISPDGQKLSLTQQISTEGEFPRDFALDATEIFLLAANQNTNNLTLYQRDSTNGKLTLKQNKIPCTEPVCVHFLTE